MGELRDYQYEDAVRIRDSKIIGVFNEQRTGKTPTTCAALSMMDFKRGLIIGLASLNYNWSAEYKQWGDTETEIIVIDSTKFDPSTLKKNGRTIVIMNYEKLRGDSKYIAELRKGLLKWKPDAVVIDEAHRIKNRKGQTFKALKLFRKAPIKIALTGTPAPNRPWEVWAILNWLFPDMYSSYWKFIEEYFHTVKNWHSGQDEPTSFKPGMEEVLQMNLDITCIQRKRKDKGIMDWAEEDIGEPIEIKLPCNKEQAEAIKSLESFFEYKNIITKNILENLIRIRQVCAAPAILGLNGKSPKLEWLKQYIKDYPEHSVIVFSHSKKFIKYISTNLTVPHVMIHGDICDKSRAAAIEGFQKNTAGVRVILIQTQAGKEGITLDNADATVFLDTYPPAAYYSQAKDRMVATVPEKVKPKYLYHVMMDGTYDETLYRLVENNVNETDIVNDYKKYIEERRKRYGNST